jgi:hypothetical protein
MIIHINVSFCLSTKKKVLGVSRTFLATLGKSWPPKLSPLIFYFFCVCSRTLTGPQAFNIFISDCVKKDWAQQLQSGHKIIGHGEYGRILMKVTIIEFDNGVG